MTAPARRRFDRDTGYSRVAPRRPMTGPDRRPAPIPLKRPRPTSIPSAGFPVSHCGGGGFGSDLLPIVVLAILAGVLVAIAVCVAGGRP